MEVARYWRGQEDRYTQPGRGLFRVVYEKNEGEANHRRLMVRSGLLNVQMELSQQGMVGEYLKGWAKTMVGVMRGRGFEEGGLKKLGFELAAMIGKDGGEEFAAAVIEEMEGERVQMPQLLSQMKELGIGQEMAAEWVFSVNGYRRSEGADQASVAELMEMVYAE